MARKKDIEVSRSPSLTVSYADACRLIDERIQKGMELRNKQINSLDELVVQKKEFEKWDAYNAELLRKIFTTETLADEYNSFYGAVSIVDAYSTPRLSEEVKEFKEKVQDDVNRLDSIKERLPLFDETLDRPSQVKAKLDSNNVFIVHGHDHTLKLDVARTLEKLGLNPIILNEKPNSGQTIIEKLEKHSDVGFAVVLLTPDDEGKQITSSKLNPRARQNVLIELGYFIGKIGRQRVCPIYVEGVEIPSDFDGVVYVPFDKAWKFELCKELKAAGYIVSADKLLD